MTFSYTYLVIPNEIINGGVTSSALILNALTGIGISILVNVLTLLLLLSCLIFLGREFFLKSILSSFCFMFFFHIFYSLNISIDLNIVLGIIIASAFIALGYYLCISSNASTVGFDVIALILNHRNKKIDIAVAIRCINYIVLLFGLTVYGLPSIIKGVAFTFLYSFILKKMLNRNHSVAKGNIKKVV
ncbi:YitT family protein [Bacillus sp. FJAT-29790]|nr:YitT family protein [Bacillus sp. FJAT-29790]